MPIVYRIMNLLTGKSYIGSAQDTRRWNSHRSLLRRNLHSNSYLQAAWNKAGEQAFVFLILETVSAGQQLQKEQYYMDRLRAVERDFGYNLSLKAARHHYGLLHSAEAKFRMSVAGKRRKGIKRGPTPEKTKRLLSELLKGNHFHTDISKAKIGAASRITKRTPEWCQKISSSQKGKLRWTNQEKDRIRKQRLGSVQSEATKQKRSATLKLLFASPVYRLRRSEWTKRAWKTRKNTVKMTSSL